jgi:hypothetical protein
MRAHFNLQTPPGRRAAVLAACLGLLSLAFPTATGQQVKVKIEEEKTVEGEEVAATGPVDPQLAINPTFPGGMSYGLAAGQQRLTFSAGSARTLLQIDGQILGPNVQQMALPPDNKGKARNGVQSTFTHGKVTITQVMEVVPGRSSDKPPPGQKRKMNVLLIRYLVENKDTQPHKVGVRVRIDTYCGSNDGCLFASPKTHKNQILDGVLLKDKQVPDFLMILENPNLQNPGFTGHFTFRMGNKFEPPNRVALTSHGAGENGWEVQVMQAGGDSDVAFYWDPRVIPAGAKREFAFAHGVGIASVVAGEGDVRLTFGGNFEPGKLFTLTARVENPGEGQSLTLELPAGMERVEGAETQPVPGAGTDEAGTVMWKARVLRPGTYTIRVRSGNGTVLTRTVTITPVNGKQG